MGISDRHPKDDLLRYLDGAMEGEEKRALEEHLTGCAECREYISFVKGFNQDLAGLSKEEFTSHEPCPDSWTLVAYEAGKVDEETARHLRAHLLFCDECAKEFYALRRVSQEESWRMLIERLKQFVIDLARSYGPGAMVGPVRIVAEQPAFALRAAKDQQACSKVLEVSLGDNAYSIELTLSGAGSLSCDIAAFRSPVRAPLDVSVRRESGEEIMSTRSDDSGKCHFTVEASLRPGNLCILTLSLESIEQHLILQIPER
jgi:hypothetical protein